MLVKAAQPPVQTRIILFCLEQVFDWVEHLRSLDLAGKLLLELLKVVAKLLVQVKLVALVPLLKQGSHVGRSLGSHEPLHQASLYLWWHVCHAGRNDLLVC